MTDVMTHRGPNDRGTLQHDGVAIGVRRLSIVDVEGGHQPFSNERGSVWAAQNGELYNHLDVRSALSGDGHVFRTRCDTEILPHLYERDGSPSYGILFALLFATGYLLSHAWGGRSVEVWYVAGPAAFVLCGVSLALEEAF